MKTIYYAIQNIIRGKDSTLIKVVSLSLGLFFSIIMFALVGVQLASTPSIATMKTSMWQRLLGIQARDWNTRIISASIPQPRP